MILNNQNKNSSYYTHGFHPYPAKFTPQIVNKFLNLYCKPGFTILDPFCGSGTTLVEGILNGMDAIGIDLNPIAYLISKAKTNNYTVEDIITVKDFLSRINISQNDSLFTNMHIDIVSEGSIPEYQNRNHWFQKNVSNELSILKKMIEEIESSNAKDLLYCAFSKIIVKVSNQDSEVRYTAKNKNHPDGIVYTTFFDTVSNYIKILNDGNYKVNAKAIIHNGDTYHILREYSNNHFDFIITSPPYINTFDYYLYHKQRMFWLGYDHRPVRQKEIGNHHRIDTKSFHDARKEYIDSMSLVMNELSRVSKPNSYFIIVIGDGIVDGNTIDMSQVIENICDNCYYKVENIESINLSEITRSFNKKFSNAPKKEHTITLKNLK